MRIYSSMDAVLEEAQLIKIAKALGDPTRFRIFRTIVAKRELSCGQVAERFPIAQATVSHHLKVLVDAGLVAVRREGQHSHFRAVDKLLVSYRRSLGRLAVT